MRIPLSARIAGGAAALIVTAAACSTGTGGGYSTGSAYGQPAPAAAGAATTVAAHQDPLGTILVDGSGRTLYLFANDTSPTLCRPETATRGGSSGIV